MAIPTDPLFTAQWHLLNTGQLGGFLRYDLNVVGVWDDYTGRGVRVGVVDSGVDYRHPDLGDNYDFNSDYDATTGDDDAAPGTSGNYYHGTAVAGLIAAEADNGLGGVGVAPDATIVAFRAIGEGGSPGAEVDAMRQQVNVDVSNNSWAYTNPFQDNFQTDTYRPLGDAMADAATNGRAGLGTVLVLSAGNGAEMGDNADYHNFTSSRFGIAVGAAQADGTISEYSSPGASVLVSAFGSGIPGSVVTTDVIGPGGSARGDYTDSFNGTSAAAPMVSGIVSLMLEANPSLGYRDVQEILACSARATTPIQTTGIEDGWQINGASDWNGGGMHVSHQFGCGLVDAHAAVRLAETWTDQSTLWNEYSVSATSSPGMAIPDGGSITESITINSTQPLEVDHVEVDLDLSHGWIGDLSVVLTSPSGTSSVLIDQPGASASNPEGLQGDGGLHFTTTSIQDWGEGSDGTWSLSVTDAAGNSVGALESWTLRVFGDLDTGDDHFVFTDEFGKMAASDPSRSVLSDAGGNDTLNVAAVTSNNVIDLRPGDLSVVAGTALTIDSGTLIENAVSGDGADAIIGNAADNVVCGGRGNDALYGNAGQDHFVFMHDCDIDVVMDFAAGPGAGDVVDLRAFGLNDFGTLSIGIHDSDAGAVINLSPTDAVVLAGVSAAQLQMDDFWL
jgi:subtilisin-like proprotein convertase family protein